jgi:hypothetical protein
MGGTDVDFAGQEETYYAHWTSWDSAVSDTNIREKLFESGAEPTNTITSDTEANMQTALDAYADTTQGDVPCVFRVEKLTGLGDFELTFDNITFNGRESIQVQYTGPDTLTIVERNGTTFDTDKLSTLQSAGTITVVQDVVVTITVTTVGGTPIQNARVLLEAAAGGDLAVGTDIATGLTDVNGQVTAQHRYTSDQPVTGRVRKASSSPYYKTGDISGTITTAGFSPTVLMIEDE